MNIQEIALESYNEHKKEEREYDMLCGKFCPSIMEKLKAKIATNFPENYAEMMGDICHEMMRLAEAEEAKKYADLQAFIHEKALAFYEAHKKIGRQKFVAMGLNNSTLTNQLMAELKESHPENYWEVMSQIEHETQSYASEQYKASQ